MNKSELRELYKMMFPDYPDVVTIAQLTKMLGIGRHMAYELINSGEIPAIRLGNAYKITKPSIIHYFIEHNISSKQGV